MKTLLSLLSTLLPLLPLDARCDEGALAVPTLVGPNCEYAKPPSNAFRRSTHGVNLLFLPNDVPSKYNGCQSVWLDNGQPLVRHLFKGGRVVFSYFTEPDQPPYSCYYENEALAVKKSGERCPRHE
jgi:hypothetical protein